MTLIDIEYVRNWLQKNLVDEKSQYNKAEYLDDPYIHVAVDAIIRDMKRDIEERDKEEGD
jgi:hypothetical protein